MKTEINFEFTFNLKLSALDSVSISVRNWFRCLLTNLFIYDISALILIHSSNDWVVINTTVLTSFRTFNIYYLLFVFCLFSKSHCLCDEFNIWWCDDCDDDDTFTFLRKYPFPTTRESYRYPSTTKWQVDGTFGNN